MSVEDDAGKLEGRGGTFPWKTLPSELTRRGYILQHYPEDVLMPGKKHTSLVKSKGIHDLSLCERRVFADALKNNMLTIKMLTKPGTLANLSASRRPVIMEEAPAPHSNYTHGRHWYANGRCDWLGLPCLEHNNTTLPSTPSSTSSAPTPSPLPSPTQRLEESVEVPSSTWHLSPAPLWRPAPALLSRALSLVTCRRQRLKVFVEVPLPPASWRAKFNKSSLGLSDGATEGRDEVEVDELFGTQESKVALRVV
ncbi:hypothetical protein C8R48DRAFT_768693 [Suillus tomentosus]|nr:hypothetical protein C8R48DRAFT_768693 [Suillus tomentosus]